MYDSTVVQLYGKISTKYLNCLGKKRDMVNTFMSKKTFHFGQRCVCECANYTPKNAHVRVRVRLEFWQNAHVRAMCVRPKIECANVRACEAKNRRNSQIALGK